MSVSHFYGTGRRKTAVAKVWIAPGKGNIIINNRPYKEYFTNQVNIIEVEEPLRVGQKFDELDVNVQV